MSELAINFFILADSASGVSALYMITASKHLI